MIENIIKIIFGDTDKKKVNTYLKVVKQVKEKEKELENFSLEDVKNKTKEFQSRFKGLDFQKEDDSQKIKELLEEIKIEATANLKQATKLLNGQSFTLSSGKQITWNMIPYDVQIVGGLAIHDGNIGEMKTGEGKTLVATIPAYLNALTGNSVHIVTVNDYLASRDAEEMGVLFNALGLQTGVVTSSQNKEEKVKSYKSDIVYATNNELGFDYLRDNMVIKLEDKVQSPLFFAIIDEVDSILIDEARTPLIISMPDNEPTSKYLTFAALAKKLKVNIDYKIDEKQKAATLTESGIESIEKTMGIDNIYVSEHYNDIHHIENALKATAVYIKDKDYLVVDEQVMIIDEHTGRVLAGRRYSEGLHQAIEAKEGVKIQQESKTLASITFQNYFRMYWKLSGMTGTAKTEEEEFYKVYALETLAIPTNKPIIRDDRSDLLFKNEKGKFSYVVELIKELNQTGQPILVGTVSVDKSEYLSKELQKVGIKHNVLNAKHHEQEADIVGSAGQKGAVTIATNMAGRGTDIKLGEGVIELGGLIILGTEKHETRRIDNQLRGRAGRQGDPGMTQFLISPQDDIMRIFGGDKLFGIFNSPAFASIPDNEPLAQSGMLTRRVTGVQKQVEGHHFDSRKHVLEYDDVINKHREVIYGRRNKILRSENIDEDIKDMIISQVSKLIEANLIDGASESWNLEKLSKKVNDFLDRDIINYQTEKSKLSEIENRTEIMEYISNLTILELENIKKKANSIEEFYDLERRIVLQSIDELWMRHIDSMSKLREAVAFEGYAQRQPLVVYKEKAFDKFTNLIGEIEYKTTKAIFNMDKNTHVDQVDMSKQAHKFNEDEIKSMLESYSNDKKTIQNKNGGANINPLFANPAGTPNQNQVKKKKIRV